MAGFVAPQAPGGLIELARIGGAWGVKGQVKLIPFSADAEALQEASYWYVLPPAGRAALFSAPLRVDVAHIRVQGDALVAQLKGVDDRDWAQALRGATIALPRSAFPALPDGEYYWVDLIGLAVVNRQGVQLGHVREMLSNGPQSVLVVQEQKRESGLAAGKAAEHLIPFVEVYVDAVDLAGQTITVDWQPDY
ncbi:hypothetical protein AAV94_09380 [Lampropedia cohaerens]|uniref:Ribosome maturation factor RimM n=1 Tax=Lampropedia cohaerens TaxID=1610491 RepID=A0A0U1PYP7_9BURK|nr:ribosome maturation factor RimM [Lampropedia cohaerens]KKW67644.1 hypothetical protein AAV94_09380 [Lampropedia cohaerens]